MSLTDSCVTVCTRAAGRGTVVIVDELQERRIATEHLTDIVVRCMSAGEDVTCVDADAEARVCEARNEVYKLIVVCEHLCALTSGCLEKKRAVRGGVYHRRGNVGPHVL